MQRNNNSFWQVDGINVDARKTVIAQTFDEAIKCLESARDDSTLLNNLGLKADELQQAIDTINETKDDIAEKISENHQKMMNSGILKDQHTADKLCRDSLNFAIQLSDTVTIATNNALLKDATENQIEDLKISFKKLQSTANPDTLPPRVKTLLKSLALCLIYPAAMSVFWSIVMPATLIASLGLPVILPVLAGLAVIGFALTYGGFASKARKSAEFETDLRDNRVNTASVLRSSLFKPIVKRHSEVMEKKYEERCSNTVSYCSEGV